MEKVDFLIDEFLGRYAVNDLFRSHRICATLPSWCPLRIEVNERPCVIWPGGRTSRPEWLMRARHIFRAELRGSVLES
jgi:hypothetical protein